MVDRRTLDRVVNTFADANADRDADPDANRNPDSYSHSHSSAHANAPARRWTRNRKQSDDRYGWSIHSLGPVNQLRGNRHAGKHVAWNAGSILRK